MWYITNGTIIGALPAFILMKLAKWKNKSAALYGVAGWASGVVSAFCLLNISTGSGSSYQLLLRVLLVVASIYPYGLMIYLVLARQNVTTSNDATEEDAVSGMAHFQKRP